jgi:hypothetical protein
MGAYESEHNEGQIFQQPSQRFPYLARLIFSKSPNCTITFRYDAASREAHTPYTHESSFYFNLLEPHVERYLGVFDVNHK